MWAAQPRHGALGCMARHMHVCPGTGSAPWSPQMARPGPGPWWVMMTVAAAAAMSSASSWGEAAAPLCPELNPAVSAKTLTLRSEYWTATAHAQPDWNCACSDSKVHQYIIPKENHTRGHRIKAYWEVTRILRVSDLQLKLIEYCKAKQISTGLEIKCKGHCNEQYFHKKFQVNQLLMGKTFKIKFSLLLKIWL